MSYATSRRGFTLIELLVVISIISILSAIVYANFNSARSSARDDVRQSSLKELQLAVELYKAQTGAYPAALTDLVPDYIQSVPTDPADGSSFGYTTGASNTYYKIYTTNVESQTINNYQAEFARCPSSCGSGPCAGSAPANTYAVYSVGAECE